MAECLKLQTELAAIKPEHTVAQALPANREYPLYEIERKCIQSAIDKRINEFAAGRAAAREALALLPVPAQAIGRGGDRCPVWPSGIVGSISHSGGVAAAVVGRAAQYRSLGLDIEGAEPLKNSLLAYILNTAELAEQMSNPIVGNVPICKASFVAKEALFKAVYPLTRKMFGFLDAHVKINADGSWTGYINNEEIGIDAEYASINGRWSTTNSLIVAVAHIQNK